MLARFMLARVQTASLAVRERERERVSEGGMERERGREGERKRMGERESERD